MEVLDAHRALAARLLPGADPDALTVRQGQFHTVIIAPDRVVCLPRTAAAAARLPGRAARLRTLAALDLGFRIPEPLADATAQGPDEPPFLLLSRVPGAPLEPGALDDPQVAGAVAAQYAALLAALAEAGADPAVRAALPRTPEDRWRRFAADVRAELFGMMSDAGRRRAERELAAAEGLPPLAGAVVHGDLGPENVLWEDAGDGPPRLAGVIDWDEAALGDPAEDLAAIGAGHGRGLLARVLAPRGLPDGGLAARIAAIGGTFALQQALAAHRDGDAEELADGLAGY
ncbi:aminoglycoside phosphotransferase family protein [Spirillospora sp. NPDC127200]